MGGEPDYEGVRDAIRAIGYAVAEGLVDEGDVRAMRDFWLAEFRRPTARAPIIWGPYLGEPNGKLIDYRDSHYLYRSFDYLWNQPYDALTRRVALDLNRMRNRLVGFGEREGEFYDPGRYGIYVTTSLYPCGKGRLHEHQDEMDGRAHWHFLLPLTFRGADFTAGGLRLTDRAGNRVDTEALLSPGSVLFYDGTLPHAVDLIEGAPGQPGRLQMFAIPVRFAMPRESDRMGADLPLRRVLRSKASRLKWRLLGALGK